MEEIFNNIDAAFKKFCDDADEFKRKEATMAGTREGGLKAAKTNALRHGADFYAGIGRKGGKNGHTGGFASMVRGADGLTGVERARIAGAKGGKISKRTKKETKEAGED